MCSMTHFFRMEIWPVAFRNGVIFACSADWPPVCLRANLRVLTPHELEETFFVFFRATTFAVWTARGVFSPTCGASQDTLLGLILGHRDRYCARHSPLVVAFHLFSGVNRQ